MRCFHRDLILLIVGVTTLGWGGRCAYAVLYCWRRCFGLFPPKHCPVRPAIKVWDGAPVLAVSGLKTALSEVRLTQMV